MTGVRLAKAGLLAIIVLAALPTEAARARDKAPYAWNNRGLVLISLHPRPILEDGVLGREQLAYRFFELRHVETDQRIRFDYDPSEVYLAEVAPGYYCVSKIEFTDGSVADLCSESVFPSNGGELANAGVWTIGVQDVGEGRKESVLIRALAHRLALVYLAQSKYSEKHPNFFHERELSQAGEVPIRGTTWYSRDLTGEQRLYRFYPNGKFELVDELWNVLPGRWKLRGNRITAWAGRDMRYKRPPVDFSGEIRNGRIEGVINDNLGTQFKWIASSNPFSPSFYNYTDRLKLVALTNFDYPKNAFKKHQEGYVKLRYRVPVYYSQQTGLREVARPTDFEVLESYPSGVFDEAAKLGLIYRHYALPIVDGEPQEQLIEEIIKFEISVTDAIKVTGLEGAEELQDFH